MNMYEITGSKRKAERDIEKPRDRKGNGESLEVNTKELRK